jgi:prevent-host-death family protein
MLPGSFIVVTILLIDETSMRMGLRQANQSFSKAIKAVKAGIDVVLTERGKPIAVIKPLKSEKDEKSILRQLEAEGLLRRGPKSGTPMRAWRAPVHITGKSISKTISEERDER